MSITHAQPEQTIEPSLVAIFRSPYFVDEAIHSLDEAEIDRGRISVVGRAFQPDDLTGGAGFEENPGVWGKNGLFWTGLRQKLEGAYFLSVPFIGPTIMTGQLASFVTKIRQDDLSLSGSNLLAATLQTIGIARDAVLRYEAVMRNDGILVILHGPELLIRRGRSAMLRSHAVTIDMHANRSGTRLLSHARR